MSSSNGQISVVIAPLYSSQISFNSGKVLLTISCILSAIFFLLVVLNTNTYVEYKNLSEIFQETSWKLLCLWSGKKLLLNESHDYEIFHNAVEINR